MVHLCGRGVSLSEKPNIVLITCHDLGRHLGCYGVSSVRSPNLDVLALKGVRFLNAFCAAPQCSPSRAALATGRYPHQNGVMGLAHNGFGWELHRDEQHAASLLGAHGYETHLFGLQHITQQVERLGFHHLHNRGFGRDVATDVASFLRGHNPGNPLYVEVNFFEPHRPYDHGGVKPDEEAGVSVPLYLQDDVAAREEMAALQGAVREVDEAVGRILSALEQGSSIGETLVVFTADHGLAMPRAKCTLYEPGIEIPLMISWRDSGIGGGRLLDDLVSNVDVLPTLLEVSGAEVPQGTRGRSLLPLLREDHYDARDAVYAEKTFHSYYDPMRCVRTGRFKYIRNFEAGFQVEVPADVQEGPIFRLHAEEYSTDRSRAIELYDLRSDPLEQDNLAGEAGVSGIEQELDTRLWRWMNDTDDPLLYGPVASPIYQRTLQQRSRKS